MTEQTWTPQFPTPTPTVTKIVRSHAFLRSRERSVTIIESSDELRALADLVDTLDQASGPLAAVVDRVAAAVRFLRDRAHGGAAPDDLNVALVVSGAGVTPDRVTTPVQTTQIAPTILSLLGLNPRALQAV